MKYQISYKNPLTHYIDIECEISGLAKEVTLVQLPAWRPGRYEIANFSKNIRGLEVYGSQNEKIAAKKVTKDCWEINTKSFDSIKIKYEYYAFEMDAGNSWLDDEQLYINFINCSFYVEGQQNKPIDIYFDLPKDYRIACSLFHKEKHALRASNFYELVDSPMFASKDLNHLTYKTYGYTFHIWIQGKIKENNKEQLRKDFLCFTEAQITTMGEFPESEYHFLIQLLPYSHYHGVEHQKSTVIVIGPDKKIEDSTLYSHLLGVSSHELFHAWNVMKIKPKEFQPYEFSKETYFDVGFIIEGITTYYGDLFLARSGCFTIDDYLKKLNRVLERHFLNQGRHYASITDSSLDLWLDGYTAGAPGRKVSIYVKGAVIALMLDLEIRKATNDRASLDTLMKVMWVEFGKREVGYTLNEFVECAEKVAQQSLKNFFDDYIYGTAPVENELEKLLSHIGCQLVETQPYQSLFHAFGFRINNSKEKNVIVEIDKDSPAQKLLSLQDEVISINQKDVKKDMIFEVDKDQDLKMEIVRSQKKKNLEIPFTPASFFNSFKIEKSSSASTKAKKHFTDWLKPKNSL